MWAHSFRVAVPDFLPWCFGTLWWEHGGGDYSTYRSQQAKEEAGSVWNPNIPFKGVPSSDLTSCLYTWPGKGQDPSCSSTVSHTCGLAENT